MNPLLVLAIISIYFVLLMTISYFTSRNRSDESYFTGDRQSPWFLVAFGMVGAGLSGVTFVSLPGMVGNNNFYFYQFILGNVVGYLFITFVLIPLYYRLRLVSIYGYLDQRYGVKTYKTGSLFFLVSQSFGAALRLLLASKILQFALFDKLNIPFPITVIIILLLVWLYTNKSGIKTIVWTDTLQTTFLVLGAIITIYTITTSLNLSFSGAIQQVTEHKYFEVFNWENKSSNNFFKQFIAGILVAIAMIGLDQNMMQKTLTCKNQWDAQKNTLTYSLILAITQFLFLGLGILLYIYAENNGIALAVGENGALLDTDNLFPDLALNHLGVFAGISFLLGIIAASFSSVDSSLTALTTSFTYDFLDISHKSSADKKRLKNWVLLGFSGVLFLIIMLFANSRGDVVSLIFKVAGYTYGPLLGLYMLGMFTKIAVKDKWVPLICVMAPVLTYLLSVYFAQSFNFDFGFINIAVNAGLTILGLLLVRRKRETAG
ncbi:Na+/proline symporter [Arenibacter algicola]|uniref:Na+/proline symporter n=1 Tax=Arenibacter algicola TaxID=616991 RepID=A0A221UU05_9FLAO|nr:MULTISPECIES: sodium:solute symporter [Arenibacter]ASO04825.1 sodium/glucose cotransporter [Arenibacter algicola]GBF18575.1 sodium/glucose cotransporter [Arenibacter sp. NBRC 103722]